MLRNISFTAAVKFLSTLLSVASVVILAYTLGNAGLGAFALARAVPSMLAIICEFGAHNSAPYLIRRMKLSPQKILENLLSVALLAGILECIIWMALLRVLRDHFFLDVAPYDILFVLIAPLGTFASTFESILRGTSKIPYANGVRIVGELVLFLVLCGLFIVKSPSVMVAALVISRTFAAAFGAISVAKTLGLHLIPMWDVKIIRQALNYGWRTQLGNMANILNYRLDHLIIGVLSGPGLVGIYSVATKAAEVFRFLPGSVRYVIEPILSELSPRESRSLTNRWIVTLVCGNAIVVAIAFVIGPYLLPIAFDEWSVESVLPFQILLIGILAVGANGAVSAFNLSSGRPEFNAYPVIGGLVVTVIADVILIPLWGVRGAAWASTLSYSTSAALLLGRYWFGNSRES
jgi:O-antigen/teichoic acid export membrane protein